MPEGNIKEPCEGCGILLGKDEFWIRFRINNHKVKKHPEIYCGPCYKGRVWKKKRKKLLKI